MAVLDKISVELEVKTNKLDTALNNSERKINRFSINGLQALNNLNRFNVNSGQRELDKLNGKMDSTQNEINQTILQIKELDKQLDSIRANIAETSGLNLQFDTSQKTDKPMTTTQYQARLDKLSQEDKLYNSVLGKQIKLTEKTEKQGISLGNVQARASQLEKTTGSAAKFQGFSNAIKGIGSGLSNAFGNVVKGIGRATYQTLRWTSMLVGVGSIFTVITKGVQSYINSNEQVKADIDYMFFAIGQALAPAITWVISLFQNLLGIVGAIAQVFFGVNIFANSLTKYTAQQKKNTAGTAKNLQGQLASFDEINTLQSQNSGSSGGGGGSETGIAMPTFSIGDKVNEWMGKIEEIKKKIEELKPVLDIVIPSIVGVAAAFALWKLITLPPAFFGIMLICVGIVFVISGIIDLLNGDLMKSFGKVLIGAGLIMAGVLIIFGIIPALITGLVILIGYLIFVLLSKWEAFTTGLKYLWDTMWTAIKGFFLGIWNWIVDKVIAVGNRFVAVWEAIKIGFSNAWTAIKGFFFGIWNWICEKADNIGKTFSNIWDNVLTGFSNIWNKIKGIVGNIGSFIGSTIKGIVNGILLVLETAINGFFWPINKGISVLRNLPGLSGLQEIRVSIPRLAKGGVATSSTIANIGEGKYPEAVVPLGQSPQFVDMKQDIANAVVSAMGKGKQQVVVNLDLGGTKFGKAIIDLINDTQSAAGKTLLEV